MFFQKPKKKSPFEFNRKLDKLADIYASVTCESAMCFLKMLELNPLDTVDCQKTFGLMTYIMFIVVGLNEKDVYSIIGSMQHNMYENGMSKYEINNFFDMSDKYFQNIVARLQRHENVADVMKGIFVKEGKYSSDFEATLEVSTAVEAIAKGYKEFDEKIQTDIRNHRNNN